MDFTKDSFSMSTRGDCAPSRFFPGFNADFDIDRVCLPPLSRIPPMHYPSLVSRESRVCCQPLHTRSRHSFPFVFFSYVLPTRNGLSRNPMPDRYYFLGFIHQTPPPNPLNNLVRGWPVLFFFFYRGRSVFALPPTPTLFCSS